MFGLEEWKLKNTDFTRIGVYCWAATNTRNQLNEVTNFPIIFFFFYSRVNNFTLTFFICFFILIACFSYRSLLAVSLFLSWWWLYVACSSLLWSCRWIIVLFFIGLSLGLFQRIRWCRASLLIDVVTSFGNIGW